LTPEFTTTLCAISRDISRVVGVLIDRRGQVLSVTVGDARRLYLPDLGRARAGGARFRGLRLLRTTLSGTDPLSQDDLTDLSKLQLDAVTGVIVDPQGRPGQVRWAHLVPSNPDNELWRTQDERSIHDIDFVFSEFIQDLESEFESQVDTAQKVSDDNAMIVYVRTRDDYNHAHSLAELYELARTAGVNVVESYVQSRQSLDPKFAVGQGALEDIELRALQLGVGILVFGQDLNPAQSRTIADRTQMRVVDRTQLILDIFAQRAQSRVGKLQVELAQLRYRLPRASARNTGLSRLAGGIGGRGPGETKLEIDRRRIRDRIRNLEAAIKRIAQGRALRRKSRNERNVPVVSIVGYTNAGKSTLLNVLTNASVLSEDKLFATLDPTSRRLRFPHEREIILTDTVGFIRDLPTELREAFRATLEELADSDLLLHIVDATDPALEEHMKSTNEILDSLDLQDTPRILVFNKADGLTPDEREELEMTWRPVMVSALVRETVRPLIDEIDRWLLAHGYAGSVADHHIDAWGVDEDGTPVALASDESDDGPLHED
jgi:GTP-binding protein HflX